MLLKVFFLISAIGCCTQLFSQSGEINGRIVDSSTRETLPYVSIFINNTTINTSTDENGDFELRNVPFGVHDFIVSYTGYKLIRVSILVKTEIISLGEIELVQSEKVLANLEVTGKRNPGWEKRLKQFKKVFLGNDELAEQCEILNPYVINFSKEPGGVLNATVTEPIEISNMALGYKLSFHLTHFESDKDSHSNRGQVRFAEISTKGGAIALQWMEKRKESYMGSQQHLFSSILQNQIKEEGFYLYVNKAGYKNNTSRPTSFISELGSSIVPFDTTNIVFEGNIPNTYKILMRGRVEIHSRAKITKQKTYSDIPYPISWIQVEGDTVFVNRNGSILNPQEVITSGAMNSDFVSSMLPVDYTQEKIVRIRREPKGVVGSRLEENVYVHLDKPYYYPREMIWFKAYLNYRYPILKDSMSRTLYVELINSNRKIVKSQVVRIDNGFAYGNWVLTDTLSSGMYYLRAYTNLNRNFVDNNFFVKPIPILGRTERVEESEQHNEITDNYRITINSTRSPYKTRDSIALEFEVRNKNGEALKSNLSVSVTDARQVVPIKEPFTILDKFTFETEPPTQILDVLYPVEYGISYAGQYFNKKRKPEHATLSILQGNFEYLSVMETDENGMFVENGLVFYDSSEFRFEPKNSRKKDVGRVETMKREAPSLDFSFPPYDLKIVNTGNAQRLISEYEVPRGARLLSEVLIKDEKIEEQKIRPYGKPDYVVSAKDLDISSNNLLLILQGKVPGLIIRTVSDDRGVHTEVRVARASGLTVQLSSEPLVMIDNVPLFGSAGDILQLINAYTVESIEIVTRVSPAYGSAGVNGVISIFTKKGDNADYEQLDIDLQTIKLGGYTRPDQFHFPDYSNSQTDKSQIDYRSILYWNPLVVTDSSGMASISFYSADLKTRYRVVVEGVDENNEPVRGVHYITVNQSQQ